MSLGRQLTVDVRRVVFAGVVTQGRIVQTAAGPFAGRLAFNGSGLSGVVNLAAQAGVRYSLQHPHAYVSANVDGFLAVLEACRAYPVDHLIYASSSSVHGTNTTSGRWSGWNDGRVRTRTHCSAQPHRPACAGAWLHWPTHEALW